MENQTVIVMRHAKSNWDGHASDYERPLARRGKADARNMANWLSAQPLRPTKIVSSPARRAADTAAILAEVLSLDNIVLENTLYLADRREIVSVLEDPPSECWALVGHNPGLESFVRHCDRAQVDQIVTSKLVPTAAMFAFRISGIPSPEFSGRGSLLWHQRPKWLDL